MTNRDVFVLEDRKMDQDLFRFNLVKRSYNPIITCNLYDGIRTTIGREFYGAIIDCNFPLYKGQMEERDAAVGFFSHLITSGIRLPLVLTSDDPRYSLLAELAKVPFVVKDMGHDFIIDTLEKVVAMKLPSFREGI